MKTQNPNQEGESIFKCSPKNALLDGNGVSWFLFSSSPRVHISPWGPEAGNHKLLGITPQRPQSPTASSALHPHSQLFLQHHLRRHRKSMRDQQGNLFLHGENKNLQGRDHRSHSFLQLELKRVQIIKGERILRA